MPDPDPITDARNEAICVELARKNEAVKAIMAARTLDEVVAAVASYPTGKSVAPQFREDNVAQLRYGNAWRILTSATPFTHLHVSWSATPRSLRLGRPALVVRRRRQEREVELWKIGTRSHWASATCQLYRVLSPESTSGALAISHYATNGAAAIPRGETFEVEIRGQSQFLRHGVQIDEVGEISISDLRDFVADRYTR